MKNEKIDIELNGGLVSVDSKTGEIVPPPKPRRKRNPKRTVPQCTILPTPKSREVGRYCPKCTTFFRHKPKRIHSDYCSDCGSPAFKVPYGSYCVCGWQSPHYWEKFCADCGKVAEHGAEKKSNESYY